MDEETLDTSGFGQMVRMIAHAKTVPSVPIELRLSPDRRYRGRVFSEVWGVESNQIYRLTDGRAREYDLESGLIWVATRTDAHLFRRPDEAASGPLIAIDRECRVFAPTDQSQPGGYDYSSMLIINHGSGGISHRRTQPPRAYFLTPEMATILDQPLNRRWYRHTGGGGVDLFTAFDQPELMLQVPEKLSVFTLEVPFDGRFRVGLPLVRQDIWDTVWSFDAKWTIDPARFSEVTISIPIVETDLVEVLIEISTPTDRTRTRARWIGQN